MRARALRHFGILWGVERRIVLSRWRPPAMETVLKAAVVVFFAALFMAAMYWAGVRTLRYMLRLPDVSPFFVLGFAERMLAMVYLFVFSMVGFSLVSASLPAKYTGKDLVLLHSLPLHPQALFQARFLGTLLASSYVAVVFPVPLLLAVAHVFGGNASFYLTLPPVLLLFVLTPGCLGALVTLMLMRWLPAEKTARLLAVAGVVLVSGMVFLLRFMRPEDLFAIEETDELRELLRRVALPAAPFLPSSWAARVSIGALEGMSLRQLAGPLWGLASLAAGAWLLLATAARSMYREAWETANLTEHVTWRTKRMPGAGLLLKLLSPFHARTRALFVKDFLTFFRDSSQWSQLVLLAALVVVYLYNLTHIPLPLESVRNMMAFLNIGMAGFVMAAVAARFVYPAVSMEGRAVWLLYSAPMRISRLLWQKGVSLFIPLYFLSTVMVSLSNRLLEVTPFIYGLSFLILTCVTVVLVCMGLGLGAGMPQFEEESPARIAVSGGAMLYISLSLVYVGLVLALAARPVFYHFSANYMGWEYGASSWPWYGAIVCVSILAAWLPLRWGAARLRRHEA